MVKPSNVDHKERERQVWVNVADGWRRRDELLRKGAEPVTERMMHLARVSPGQRVLDIASGTGEPAIPMARRVGPQGYVIGTDLVEEMLMIAREKATLQGVTNIEFRCVDGEQLDIDSGTFDVVSSRWGMMFMPDPHACLQQVYRALKPGGRFVVACWAAAQDNPFISLAMTALKDYMEVPAPVPGAPGIFAYADRERLQDELQSAGFHAVAVERLELVMIEVDNGAAYWDVLQDLAGPIMTLVNQLDAKAKTAFEIDLINRADALSTGEKLLMRGTTWIAVAIR